MSQTQALFSLTSLVHYITERASNILDKMFLNDWFDIGDSRLFTTISLIMYHTFFPYKKRLNVCMNHELACKDITAAYELLKGKKIILFNKLNQKFIINASYDTRRGYKDLSMITLPTSMKQRLDFSRMTEKFLLDLGTNLNFPFLSQYDALELFGIIAWQHAELLFSYGIQQTVYRVSQKFQNRVKNLYFEDGPITL